MASHEGELLADEDVVLRAVHEKDVRNDGTLKHPAFFVSRNGKDNIFVRKHLTFVISH